MCNKRLSFCKDKNTLIFVSEERPNQIYIWHIFYNIFCFSQVMLLPLNLSPLNVYYYLEMTNFHHSFPEQCRETRCGWEGNWKMNLGCHYRLKLALELSSLTGFTSIVILKVWAWTWNLSEAPVVKRFYTNSKVLFSLFTFVVSWVLGGAFQIPHGLW